MTRRVAISIVASLCAVVLTVSYLYSLRRQHEARAILSALADVEVGVTKKGDFLKQMTRFNGYKSPTEFVGYSNGATYHAVEYTITNTFLDRYSMFPRTVISASVYFDSNDIAHHWIVTIDNESALATMENELDPSSGISPDVIPHSEPAQWPEKRVLHLPPQDLKRISTSCFTSWTGCDTNKRLLTGSK